MAEPGRKNEPYGRFFGQAPVDGALAALGAGRHAVVELEQLRAIGLTPRAVQKRAAAGRLHRIHQGVYSLVPRELLTREGHWLAAVFACGPGAVLSHRSAGALHALRPSSARRIDVTLPGRSCRERAGIHVHRSISLAPEDVTRVKNIPCTTVARTLLDLAEVVSQRSLERACEQAERIEVFDLRALQRQIAHNAPRPGAHRLRAVLEEHYIAGAPTESELEEAFLALIRAAGIPRPERQYWILLPDGGAPIRADFAWPAERVVVETDGRGHGTRDAFERDRRNGQRLAAAGWKPIRTTWLQIRDEPVRTAGTVVQLLQL